jgi:hypothetical protein
MLIDLNAGKKQCWGEVVVVDDKVKRRDVM